MRGKDIKHRDKDWLCHHYCVLGKTIREMARETSKSRNTIKIWLKKFGIQIVQDSERIRDDFGRFA